MKIFSKEGCRQWLDKCWRAASAAWKRPRGSPSWYDQSQNIKIISYEECWQWLESNLGSGFTRKGLDEQYEQYTSAAITELLTRQQAEFAGFEVYHLPNNVMKRTVLAKDLSAFLIDASQPGLFWITDWGIGPSVENMALFDGYRKSLGESRPVDSAPGHIFGQAHLPQLECLLGLALYFHWDASLFTALGTDILRVSTNEWISVRVKDITHLEKFQTRFQKLGFLRKESERF